CDLLGRRTTIVACVQRFTAGAIPQSPRFFITLDGEGVELPASEGVLDCEWGRWSGDADLIAVALHFQSEVMPWLHDCSAFQRAAAEVVTRQRHLRLVAPDKLSPA